MDMNRMVQTDLRDFLAEVEAAGELKTVHGAHWDKEMGAVTEVLYREKVDKSPALMFDDIPGYNKGFRCLYGMLGSPMRLALALGMEGGATHDRNAMLNAYREKMRSHEPIPPRTVNTGPILENVLSGDDIDLEKFPVPIHHEEDGGRYIGTACGVVTRDPDTGRINVGTYRVMVIDGKTCGSYISNGKQGRIHRDKYFARGEKCPMAIIVGIDPATYMAARYTLPDQVAEYEWAGGLTGNAMDIVEGEDTGLPFPARFLFNFGNSK